MAELTDADRAWLLWAKKVNLPQTKPDCFRSGYAIGVAAERERCARIAERHDKHQTTGHICAYHIATEIRSGSPKGVR